MISNPLESVEIKRIRIPYYEQGFDVRGLSLRDILAIVTDHGRELLPMIMTRLEPQSPTISVDPMTEQEIGWKIFEACPGMIAAVIAISADSEGSESIAAKLDFGTQLLALDAIFKLTKQTLDMGELRTLLALFTTNAAELSSEGVH